MAYDDLKKFNGRKYMGMPIGGKHVWDYPNGTWKEMKVNPDCWVFTFQSIKQRKKAAPVNSGAHLNTEYHWYIMADQRVRKIDKDKYETLMQGLKHKLSHKRPYWRKWSSEYQDNISNKDRLMMILEDMLKKIKGSHLLENDNVSEMYLQSL